MSKGKLIKELQRRASEATAPKWDISKFCFDKQLEFIRDPAKRKGAVTSRRGGKTKSCAADLHNTSEYEEGDVAYITLNRLSAKKIIWRELLDINRIYNLGGQVNNSELTIKKPNGNLIHVTGAKDASEIEKLRGLKFRKIYIDEAQSFRGYLKELVDDVLEPTLIDYDGSLVLTGTPGPVLGGYFYEAYKNPGWSFHHWTMHDNPYIKIQSGKDPEQIIKEVCERRGVPQAHPSIQREFYGKWVQDNDSLVYKFDKARNICANIPENLQYIFGIDIGFQDYDAIGVLGYSYTDNRVYLVEEWIADKQTVTQLANRIEELQKKYNPLKMVMDAGGLGKKIQEELRHRFALPIEAADKARKFEFIEFLNDDLRTGRFQTFKGSRFEEDTYLVQWDYTNPEKVKISTSYHTDIGDAVLYGWRECKHYFYKPEPPKVAPKPDDFMAQLEEKEAEAMASKGKDSNIEQFTDVTSFDDIGVTDFFDDDF